MTLISALIDTISTGLKVWDFKNRTKYQDEWDNLSLEYFTLESAPYARRDQARIDKIEYRLYLLARRLNIDMKTGGGR